MELWDDLVLETLGKPGPGHSAGGPAPVLAGRPYSRMRLFFVRVDGRMVASSWIRCELQENLSSALLHVDVLNDFTGRGIGRALLEHTEALAVADGRTILQTFTEHPADFDVGRPGRHQARHRDRGAARRRARASGSRNAGYQLEQVERFSSLEMPPAPDWTPWSGSRWPRRSSTN